jgi:alpha-tubulin suppressor-like RCC1 family protein
VSSEGPVAVSGLTDAVALLPGRRVWCDLARADHAPECTATGDDHTCALRSDGTVVCWGANDRGQLGDRTTQDRTAPVSVPGLDRVAQLVVGGAHTCARRRDPRGLGEGTALCWGDDSEGQLGDGSLVFRSTPDRVPGL